MSNMDEDSASGMVGAIASLPDIADMSLDLTKDEKLRSASLILAIRYHVDTIIKDPRYLEIMIAREKEAKFSNDPEAEQWHLRPTTVEAVVHIAMAFEHFLKGGGKISEIIQPVGRAQGDI